MCRVLAATILSCAAALAAPVPKDKAPLPDYFPTAVGTKWVYQRGSQAEFTVEITGAEKKEEQTLLTMRDTNQVVKTYTVTSEEVVYRTKDQDNFDIPLLRFPLKGGETWKVAPPVKPGWIAYSGRMTVGEVEKVEVPAGTFQAVPVHFEITGYNDLKLKPEVRTYWYAPSVGLVKFKSATFEQVLKEFKPVGK